MGGFFMAGLAKGVEQGINTAKKAKEQENRNKLIDAQIAKFQAETKEKNAKLKKASDFLTTLKELQNGELPEITNPTGAAGAPFSQSIDLGLDTGPGAGGTVDIESAGTALGSSITNKIANTQIANQTQPQGPKGTIVRGGNNVNPVLARFVDEAFVNPAFAAEAERQGYYFTKLTTTKGAMFQGRKGTLRRDVAGRVRSFTPEAVKPEIRTTTDKYGATFEQSYDPYEPNTGIGEPVQTGPADVSLEDFQLSDGSTVRMPVNRFGTPIAGGDIDAPFVTKQAPVERVTQIIDGKTFSVLRYSQNNKEVPGAERILTKLPPPSTAANLAQLRARGIGKVEDIAKKIFQSDGKGGLEIPFFTKIIGLAPDNAAKLGFALARDVKGLALGILRPLSGAAIPFSEIETELEQIIPGLFTSAADAEKTMIKLGEFIDDIFTRSGEPNTFAEKTIRDTFAEIKKQKGGPSLASKFFDKAFGALGTAKKLIFKDGKLQ